MRNLFRQLPGYLQHVSDTPIIARAAQSLDLLICVIPNCCQDCPANPQVRIFGIKNVPKIVEADLV